jgi:hypothetical protein
MKAHGFCLPLRLTAAKRKNGKKARKTKKTCLERFITEECEGELLSGKLRAKRAPIATL